MELYWFYGSHFAHWVPFGHTDAVLATTAIHIIHASVFFVCAFFCLGGGRGIGGDRWRFFLSISNNSFRYCLCVPLPSIARHCHLVACAPQRALATANTQYVPKSVEKFKEAINPKGIIYFLSEVKRAELGKRSEGERETDRPGVFYTNKSLVF